MRTCTNICKYVIILVNKSLILFNMYLHIKQTRFTNKIQFTLISQTQTTFKPTLSFTQFQHKAKLYLNPKRIAHKQPISPPRQNKSKQRNTHDSEHKQRSRDFSLGETTIRIPFWPIFRLFSYSWLIVSLLLSSATHMSFGVWRYNDSPGSHQNVFWYSDANIHQIPHPRGDGAIKDLNPASGRMGWLSFMCAR